MLVAFSGKCHEVTSLIVASCGLLLWGSTDKVSIGVQKEPPIGVQKGPPSSSSVTGMTGAPFALVVA